MLLVEMLGTMNWKETTQEYIIRSSCQLKLQSQTTTQSLSQNGLTIDCPTGGKEETTSSAT
jgi:hypothetical protein